MKEEYAIYMDHVKKSFGGIEALKEVTLQIKKGSCHALVGENGAGKSTLMKILGGIIKPDEGEIVINGEKKEFKSNLDAKKMGIAFVPQELDFISYFSVAENIYLGCEPLKKATPLISWKDMYIKVENFLKEQKIDLPVKKLASELTVSQQQMMVIARVLFQKSDIIIMDEPTARLGYREVEYLLEYIKYLKTQGKTIIYISHRLEELYHICDEVTVLRNGSTVISGEMKDFTKEILIQHMVNRNVDITPKKSTGHKIGEQILQVSHLTKKGKYAEVCFHANAGEVVGFFGLVGAGRSAAIRAMLGIDKCDFVEISLSGEKVRFRSSRDALKNGVVLVPEERRTQGVLLHSTIANNISLPNLPKFTKCGFLRKKKEEQYIREVMEDIEIACNSSHQLVGELSGGNQQKVVLAKYIKNNLKVLILDEPTRGIDIGAKDQIYNIIEKMAAKGLAVIVISSEIPELQQICDRVYVMRERQIEKELSRQELIQSEQMLKYAIGI